MLIVYVYKNCDSCRKALKWLAESEVEFEQRPIRDTPPSVDELRFVLERVDGGLRKLFNTAGGDYRAMNLKESLPTMSEDEALKLLNENGNLVKRPFAYDRDRGAALVGFKADVWLEALS